MNKTSKRLLFLPLHLIRDSLSQLPILIYRLTDFLIPDLSIMTFLRGIFFKFFWKAGRFFTISKGNVIQNIGNISIGDRVFINRENIFNNTNKIKLGDYSLVGYRNLFITQGHFEKERQILNKIGFSKPITIGNNVWITSNCTILPGTVIEDNVILSAGSVAKGKLESGWIYRGNPAVKVRRTKGVVR